MDRKKRAAGQRTGRGDMKRKAVFRLVVTRRETMYVQDRFDHSMMLVEMEGEPIEYQVGVAGEFISRRSVTFHDRVRGTGTTKGYSITTFQDGSVSTTFEGGRDAATRLTTGTWTVLRGTGKLANIRGSGRFTVRERKEQHDFVLEMEGDYEL